MSTYKEDFWEELERLENKRREAQDAHDQALSALFASRDAHGMAPAEAFEEYGRRTEQFDETIKALKEFRQMYTPYR